MWWPMTVCLVLILGNTHPLLYVAGIPNSVKVYVRVQGRERDRPVSKFAGEQEKEEEKKRERNIVFKTYS